MKIALAMIVKGTKEEAVKLNRCLETVMPHVDRAFLTFNAPEGVAVDPLCFEVAAKYVATVSQAVWLDDFADMRTFNFSQVPADFDYILWLDADDMLRGGSKLRSLLEETKRDCYGMWYQYDFDEDGNVVVAHQKVRVVKNDGSFHWRGRLHENLTTDRDTGPYGVKGIDVLHVIAREELQEKGERNLRIAIAMRDDAPLEPRSYLNTGNAHFGMSHYTEALEEFDKFQRLSQSDEEKYIAHLRMAEARWQLGQRFEAIDTLRFAIGMKPTYPDAYTKMGLFLTMLKRYREAIVYLGQALTFEPPTNSIVVFNPREYDYEPIRLLALAHFELNEVDDSLKYFKLCQQIRPNDENLATTVEEIEKVVAHSEAMKNKAALLANLDDTDLLNALAKLSPEDRSHPSIMIMANTRFVKTESTGKEVSIYCGYTSFEWRPGLPMGGSEEAVVELSRKWASKGYQVSVFNNCGHQPYFDVCGPGRTSVEYRPFWEFNFRSKTDVLILWRHPMLAQYELNATKVILDLHDVMAEDEFTPERMERIDVVCVKTEAHAVLFPKIRGKVRVIPNGISPKDLEWTGKEQNLIINTSSPDRSLSALLDIYEKVKAIMPEARLEWAYGWTIWDTVHGENKHYMEWKEKMQARMKALGVIERGKLTLNEVAELYRRGHVFLYPTEFYEIFCISAVKAQMAGCSVVSSDFAALAEVVRYGKKIHSTKTKDDWCPPYKFDFAMTDKQDEFVRATVDALKAPVFTNSLQQEALAKDFDWGHVADEWITEFPKV